MESLDMILAMLDQTLNTRRKRHIVGGFLITASLVFGGLAVTVISLKMEEDYEE